MKKRILSLILAVIVFVSLLPVSAFAAKSGTVELEYGGFDWHYSNGVLTIWADGYTGSFDIYDEVHWSRLPWHEQEFVDDIHTIVVEEGVTQIGEDMFCAVKNVSRIELPMTLTICRGGAFYKHTNVEHTIYYPGGPSDFAKIRFDADEYGSHWDRSNVVYYYNAEFTVIFNANGGTVSQESKAVPYKGECGNLPVPTREGYSFDGWYRDNRYFSKEVTKKTTVDWTNDITVYAKWIPNNYTVSFDCGGYGEIPDKSVTMDTSYGELPVAERENYLFAGWYTEPEGGEEVTAKTKFTAADDVCLYAHWTYDKMSNFIKINNYDGRFEDVAPGVWYETNVQSAFEYGLVMGKTDTTFVPDGNITVGEVITLASRIHSIYHTGKAEFVQGSPWYQVYVDYAIENGLINASDYSDFKAAATRSQCALILSKTVDERDLAPINNVEKLPDVNNGTSAWANAVFKLYNAGVLTGNDKYGTFAPTTNIKRSEIATIVTRIVEPALRKSFAVEYISEISLNQQKIWMFPSDTYQLVATVTKGDASGKGIIWTSSDTAIATVSSTGLVTAVKFGTATITATLANGNSVSCDVVVQYVSSTGISLDKDYLYLDTGDSYKFTVSMIPANASNTAVTWTSSNTAVATVDSNGNVKAVGNGKATITVKTSNGQTDRCIVNVMDADLLRGYMAASGIDGAYQIARYPNSLRLNEVLSAFSDPFEKRIILEFEAKNGLGIYSYIYIEVVCDNYKSANETKLETMGGTFVKDYYWGGMWFGVVAYNDNPHPYASYTAMDNKTAMDAYKTYIWNAKDIPYN